MKNSILTLVIILVAFSCASKVGAKKDLKESAIVGNDLDVHGCRASAGYTWSVVSKECIRVFEKGIRLESVEDAKDKANTLSAFVVFDQQGNKVELFLPNQKQSIVLIRKSEGQPWIKDGWQLISWKGYVLKRDAKIVYTGQ
jgi:hypothetical protein